MKRKAAFILYAFSAVVALSLVLLLTARDNGQSSSSGDSGSVPATSEASGSNGSENSEDSESSGGSENSNLLSNPIKRTEDGDIDMEAALAYETDFDALAQSLSEREVDLSKPVSLNAQNNPKTMEIWNYLKSVYGKQIISAQQQMDTTNCFEDRVYYDILEDLPAMKGFDFIFTTGTYGSRDFIDAALEWANESSGLVTFTWHWNVPRDVDDPSKGWAFYQEEIINWNARNATVPGTKEYEVAVHDIDMIAGYLQELESAGVTVLWRPFHEASGNWFWWGVQPSDAEALRAGTYDTFQRLWYMMYDRLENYHKLSNIIWVWNGQSKRCVVDPNTYDIAGIDVYPTSLDHSPLEGSYNSLASYTYEGKMLALSECGYIPDPQQCFDAGIMWLYYMPWNGGFIYEPSNPKDLGSTPLTDFYGTPRPNPERLSKELLEEYFGNPLIISWKDLPDLPYGERNVPQRIVTWDYFRNPN